VCAIKSISTSTIHLNVALDDVAKIDLEREVQDACVALIPLHTQVVLCSLANHTRGMSMERPLEMDICGGAM
jgi:hypothetical protein